MPSRGAFIVIEGLDRSGKSTQTESLIKRLEQANVPSKLIKFPGQHGPFNNVCIEDIDRIHP